MIFRKKNEEVDVLRSRKKEPEADYEWDKKRIAIFVLFSAIIILGALELKRIFLPNTSILGASVEKPVEKPSVKPPSFNFSSVESAISDIKENVESLDAEEIASSSPQIQKVLRDIQGIKDLPANQAREMCLKVCSGI